MGRMVFVTMVTIAVAGGRLDAQVSGSTPVGAVRVFLDCQAPSCDYNHFRREIGYVNWVRDREDADVHLLVTAQSTGGGGRAYALNFIGRRGFATLQDTLHYTSRNTDTDAEIRDGLTRMIEAGLMRFAARTPTINALAIHFLPAEATPPATPEEDPWNYWVFSVGLNGSVDGEAKDRGYAASGSFGASRVTEAHRFRFRISGDWRRSETELSDSTTYVDERQGFDASLLWAQSLSPHWSLGALAEADRSTYLNHDFGFEGGPALEFSIYPYDESTRRQVTVLYAVGIGAYDFQEETVLGQTSQVLALQHLEISVAVRQPWGSIFGGASVNQYFYDLSAHRVETHAGISLRVFRGLNFNTNGSIARIKDQIFLPAGELTNEEILVRRRQRETDFRFRLRTGFSFRFGSKFANVVNTRLGG